VVTTACFIEKLYLRDKLFALFQEPIIDDRRGDALAVQVCRRFDGIGHHYTVSDAAERNTEMCAPRTWTIAERLPFRKVLPVRTAAGVQHQALANRHHSFAQAELDILAA